MSDRPESKPIPPLIDAKLLGTNEHPTVFIERKYIEMALEAGFSEDEVRYMLDLPEETELMA